MSEILAVGPMATVELKPDGEGFVLAQCVEHSPSDGRLAPPGNCIWDALYGDWPSAISNAKRHADTGNT